ncbi:unnamed protein product [Nesidiocoris tenuis]|uniref:Major facilitator superfamily (MFS) profile domain-containing protein n=1 Tax=Nesidiocoris tenuis TaxID=355587 RepID=A0A6H5G7Y3_9HEMI|nr:unnamed protein product [Nesidiocoris tenuis]CAA9998516.1 unnamed protein product [Nesidiocoris tenuis]
MLFSGALFESAMSVLSYEYLIAASAVPAVILFFGLIFIPESPYFYLMKGDRLTASENVKWLRGKCTIQDMDAMESSVKEQLANTAGFSEIFSSPMNLKPFIMVQCLKVIVGCSSIIMLMSYASTLLPDSWISAKNGATLLSLVWVVAGLFACSIMDKINRRTFLYISSIGTALALSCTTVWYYLDEKTSVDMSSTKWVMFAPTFLYAKDSPLRLGTRYIHRMSPHPDCDLVYLMGYHYGIIELERAVIPSPPFVSYLPIHYDPIEVNHWIYRTNDFHWYL